VAMMYAHLLEPPPKLSERRPDLGPAVDDVIAKAVAKSRDDRYARPSEFALALRQAVGAAASGIPVEATPGGSETILAGSALATPPASAAPAPPATPIAPATPATPAAPPVEPTPPSTAATGGGGSNRRKLAVGGAILAALVAAGVLIPLLALSDGKSSSEKTAAAGSTSAATSTAATPGTATIVQKAATLLSVLGPSQVTKECTAQDTLVGGAVEADVCASAPTDPTSQPNRFQFSFSILVLLTPCVAATLKTCETRVADLPLREAGCS